MCRFEMRFSTRISVFVGVFVLLQFGTGADKHHGETHVQNTKIAELVKTTEHVIKTIINDVKDFHTRVRKIYKCIPETIANPAQEMLKRSIDCVNDVEKKLEGQRITPKGHQILFAKCFAQRKKEVEDLSKSIDLYADMCPENMTEKTYKIDVGKSSKNSLDINIKKGMEYIQKTIVFESKTSNLHVGSHDEEEEEEEGEPEALTKEEEKELQNLKVPLRKYAGDHYDLTEIGRREFTTAGEAEKEKANQMGPSEEENEQTGSKYVQEESIELYGVIAG